MFGAICGSSMSPPFEINPSIVAAMSSSNDGSISPMQMGLSISPSRKFGPRKICRICAEEATSNHFGALSCHACAAFFRRTVAFRRTYSCRHQQNCKLINVSPRRMCKYCRLARCLAIGMQPSEVRSNGLGSSGNGSHTNTISAPRPGTESPTHSDQPSSSSSNAQSPNGHVQQSVCEMFNASQDSSTLNTLLNSKREVIFNRNNLGTCSTSNGIPPAGDYKPAEAFALLRAMILESAVCTAFLNSSGLTDYLSGKDKQTLLDQALNTWINMDMCKFTMINNGTSTERAFCINDQFIDINLQFLEKFYGVDKKIRNPQCLGRLMNSFYDRVLDLARLLEKSKLDEYEFAALAQLTLIRIACETSEKVTETQMSLAPYVSALMKDIQKYYVDNYSNDNGAIRLGKLVLLVNEMQELRQAYNKHIITLYWTISKDMKPDTTENPESATSSSGSSVQLLPNSGSNWMSMLKPEDLMQMGNASSNSFSNGMINMLFNNIKPMKQIPATISPSIPSQGLPPQLFSNIFSNQAPSMSTNETTVSLAAAIAKFQTPSVTTFQSTI
ncbi:hypothetical protein FO519_001582 [Halicephalobus sp. NKZ332]|nr:hypothetical protein FO519_001582 [Halicephalobus sp. NKZ332]